MVTRGRKTLRQSVVASNRVAGAVIPDGHMSEENASGSDDPSDTMRRRAEESRLKFWMLLEANRWVVAAVVLAAFVAGSVAVATILPSRVVVEVGDPVETLFQALVTATITGVTLVVSINSLVLSQELGPLGDQRERMEGAMSFRRDVEDELGMDVAPATPAAFLRELIGAAEDRARALSDAAEAMEGDDAGRVTEYAAELRRHASSIESELSGEEFGTFDVLSAALNFNYSWKIYEARGLRASLGESAPSSEQEGGGESASPDESEVRGVSEALDDVVAVLTLFGPAREHVKTLYFQWELVDLSRAMLYSAVPALLVATNVLLFHGVLPAFSATTLGVAHYVWIVALATAVSLAPFAILLSFVLRIGTVAKRTLSIGPLILRTTSGEEHDRRDG
jgi:hypothetical protein